MAQFPALPLWTDAYLADTMHLNCVESGAYLHLLMAAWRSPDCNLPDDDKLLSRFAKCTPRQWTKIKPVVMSFWTLENHLWNQKRLLEEIKRVRENSLKRKSNTDQPGIDLHDTPWTPDMELHNGETVGQWKGRMAAFNDNKFWMKQWGPEPGVDGCRVPETLTKPS